MLRLLLPLLALLQDPAPAAPAVEAPSVEEEWRALLEACREAPGIETTLRFRGEIARPGEEALLATELLMEIRFARPCSGRFDMSGRSLYGFAPDGGPAYVDIERTLIGTGTELFLVDHQEGSYRALGTALNQLGEHWPSTLVPLQVWAGLPEPADASVHRLEPPLQPDWRGFELRYPYYAMDFWFDAEDALRLARLRPAAELQDQRRAAGQLALPEFHIQVDPWILHREVDPAAFAQELPDGLREAEPAEQDGQAERAGQETAGGGPPSAGSEVPPSSSPPR